MLGALDVARGGFLDVIAAAEQCVTSTPLPPGPKSAVSTRSGGMPSVVGGRFGSLWILNVEVFNAGRRHLLSTSSRCLGSDVELPLSEAVNAFVECQIEQFDDVAVGVFEVDEVAIATEWPHGE